MCAVNAWRSKPGGDVGLGQRPGAGAQREVGVGAQGTCGGWSGTAASKRSRDTGELAQATCQKPKRGSV